MTTPDEPTPWIPNDAELEEFRDRLKDAIAIDAKALSITFDPDYLTGEYPEVTPQIPTYYGPQAVPLSTQNLNWLEPAFLDVLAIHSMGFVWSIRDSQMEMVCGGEGCTRQFADEQEWREHVWAELKARCDKAAGR
jgi:hypothetical protein